MDTLSQLRLKEKMDSRLEKQVKEMEDLHQKLQGKLESARDLFTRATVARQNGDYKKPLTEELLQAAESLSADALLSGCVKFFLAATLLGWFWDRARNP